MSFFSPHSVERLASARKVTVLTGAGASAESGIPTFRDPDGLWSRFDPLELATMSAFQRDPIRVQSWYSARIEAVREARPNPCHTALVALEGIVDAVTVITQNVDGLHRRAGSMRVIEMHGNLENAFCVSCGLQTDALAVAFDAAEPAHCSCGGLLRPGVVWFGEMLPEEAVEASFAAAAQADVFLSVGTAAEVYPAGGLPLLASDSGAYVLEVNLRRTAISDRVDEAVVGPAGVLIPTLVKRVTERQSAVAN